MNETQSYSKLEKELVHEFRDKLNHAESVEDVKKFFCYTVRDLFSRSMDNGKVLESSDLVLLPDSKPHFKVGGDIVGDPTFKMIWQNSDLANITGRFADAAAHKYKHLLKNPAKSKMKIKGH
jgi:hypothetical protein